MHSVMNSLFVPLVFAKELETGNTTKKEIYAKLENPENENLREKVRKKAESLGMIYLKDESGTNIDVQIFDLSRINQDTK